MVISTMRSKPNTVCTCAVRGIYPVKHHQQVGAKAVVEQYACANRLACNMRRVGLPHREIVCCKVALSNYSHFSQDCAQSHIHVTDGEYGLHFVSDIGLRQILKYLAPMQWTHLVPQVGGHPHEQAPHKG